ncbi:unnamed protein product [Rotaria sp. Silwood2]|nr:unnamed protein product [Rotaria sp. Silwood2]CAF3195847.1 unnamed protein product [Rotaria sp. Silwood2]CAF3414200.1 unnamed protein product [Rotaria sp. Silwood2]CAF3479075.1 unnamed protein product [Rotaria sp. Silwood2]CAF4481656.1 unnamed protein product [Rotaria sp. Silwood2]
MGYQLNSFTSTVSQTKSMDRIKVDNYVSIGVYDTVGVEISNPSKDGWDPKLALLISAEQTINLGRSGSILREAIHQHLPKVFKYKPNVISIWLTVNDFNQQIYDRSILTSYTSNLTEMLSQLKNKLGNDTRILVENIPDLSKKNQCDLIDLYSYWKELSAQSEDVSFDDFHPSTHGYERFVHIFYQQYLK